jgi:hypothetical protein
MNQYNEISTIQYMGSKACIISLCILDEFDRTVFESIIERVNGRKK